MPEPKETIKKVVIPDVNKPKDDAPTNAGELDDAGLDQVSGAGGYYENGPPADGS